MTNSLTNDPVPTKAEATAALTAPGAPFEIVRTDVRGIELPVYRHAPGSLREVFEHASRFGEAPYLHYADTDWSYRDHAVRVGRLATYLREVADVRPGDRVAIGMRNYPEWPLAFWAIVSIGAVAVPLNAWWIGQELEYGLSNSGAKVAVIDDERLDRLGAKLDDLDAVLVARTRVELPDYATPLDEVIEREFDAELPDADIHPDDPAVIMYTSGTTGVPKGAVQTHRSHATNLMNIALAGATGAALAGHGIAERTLPDPLAVREVQPVSLQTFPFFHIGGMSGLYGSTAVGARLICMYKWDAAEAVRLVRSEGITGISGVPTVIRQLLDELDREGDVASSLASVSVGGSPVPPSLIDRIGDRSGRAVRPLNGYGLTETSSAVVVNSGDEYYEHPDSVGRPVPVAEMSVRDEDGRPVGAGVTGELWVKGPNVVAGYWNMPDATAEAFTDGWFHTGDAAFERDDFVYVVDRLKDVVLRGGENVYCAEVEAAIHALPGVTDVAVFGVPHDVLGEEVAAAVELAGDSQWTADDLQRALADRLAAFKIPARIWSGNAPLPRNATGKLLKRELRTAVFDDGQYEPL